MPEEELKKPNATSKSSHCVSMDLEENENTASTIAARNILTTTPDPSDDDENKEHDSKTKHVTNMADSVMDIDQGTNSYPSVTTGLETTTSASLSVSS